MYVTRLFPIRSVNLIVKSNPWGDKFRGFFRKFLIGDGPNKWVLTWIVCELCHLCGLQRWLLRLNLMCHIYMLCAFCCIKGFLSKLNFLPVINCLSLRSILYYEFNFGFRMGWWYIFILGLAWLGFNEGFRIGLCKFWVKIEHWVLKGVQLSLGLVLIFIFSFYLITEVCSVYRSLWVGLLVGSYFEWWALFSSDWTL